MARKVEDFWPLNYNHGVDLANLVRVVIELEERLEKVESKDKAVVVENTPKVLTPPVEVQK